MTEPYGVGPGRSTGIPSVTMADPGQRKFWWADGFWADRVADPYRSPATAWHTWVGDSRLTPSWDGVAGLWGLVSPHGEPVSVPKVGRFLKLRKVVSDLVTFDRPEDLYGWVVTRGPVVVESPWYQSFGRADRHGFVDIDGDHPGHLAYVLNGVSHDRVRLKPPFGRNFGYRGFLYLSRDDFARLFTDSTAYGAVV